MIYNDNSRHTILTLRLHNNQKTKKKKKKSKHNKHNTKKASITNITQITYGIIYTDINPFVNKHYIRM